MLRSTRFRQLLFIFLVLSTLLLALAILGDWIPQLRGPAPETSEWYWPYLLRPIHRWWPSAAAAILTLILSFWWLSLEKPDRKQTYIALFALFGVSLLLQVTLIYADRVDVAADLVDRTLSNQASGFFEPAAEISDINQVLANYPLQMPAFASGHARTHPPGMIISNWAVIQFFSGWENLGRPIAAIVSPLRCTDLWLYNQPAAVSAALGTWAILPLLFAASTVFPAYAVAKQLLEDYTVRLATILAATMPALILFAPKSVQLYAPLTLVMFWAFHSGLFRQSPWRLLLAGVLGSILTFFSLGNSALFLLLVVYAVLAIAFILPKESTRTNRISIFWGMLAFGSGAAAIWLVYWLVWGVPPWEIAFTGLEQHYQLVTNLRRYEWWAGWNLVDLILFAGWPLMVGFLGGIILSIRRWRRGNLQPVDALAVGLTVVMLLLNFSGTARGEVGRLWLFFMPLLAFPSALFWRKALPGRNFAISIVALQLLLVLCLGWAWQTVRPVIVVAQRPLMAEGTPQTLIDANFAPEAIVLEGFSIDSSLKTPGDELALTLFWKAGEPASLPFTVFNHVVDEDGTMIAQQDGWSVGGEWPPTCWQAGDRIVDQFLIAIPPGTPAGSYRLQTGLYNAASGQRLTLSDGRDAVELGEIELEPR